MQKLGIICGTLSRGGSERVAVNIGEYMKCHGIETYILTAGLAKDEYKIPFGIERIVLSNTHNKILSVVNSIIMLRKTIKKYTLDTIIIMGVPLCIYSIPGCVHTGAKIIVSERNDPKHFAGKKIVRIFSRFFMRFSDGFVFQTNEAKEFYNKIRKGRGTVIPNPLMIEQFPEQYEGCREKIIVNIGRLNQQKNQKMLIQAFSQLEQKYPDYKLIIYGEGDLRGMLEDEIRRYSQKDRILLPGNHNDIYEKIRKASAFVLCSDFEGMPNALIEAMALGIPCISTDCPCGGPREIIKNGVNGILVPVGDVKALKEKIEFIIDNPDISMNYGKNAVSIRKELCMDNIGKLWYMYCMTCGLYREDNV